MQRLTSKLAAVLVVLVAACESPVPRPPPPAHTGVYGFAGGCFTVDATEPGVDDTRWLAPTEDGAGFAFTAREAEGGARFRLAAADLAVYLLYDTEQRYLVADDGPLLREADLLSDILTVDDTYVSGAEWEVQPSVHDAERFQLSHRRSGGYLGRRGLVTTEAEAAVIAFYPAEDCADHPELTVDAEGEVVPRTFPDGDLFGIAETHAHLLTNFGFGGGGIFHGAPFHRLGVEHALPDCSPFHGRDGRQDLFGFGYDQGDDANTEELLTGFLTGETPDFNHHTAGWPEFTDWPSGFDSSTHQTQYYRWLERAWRGGLRLLVQQATSNRVICELMTGSDIQPVRYSCADMVAVDRQIAEAYNLERYIDAQEGGPGEGWFRIVRTPEEARSVIGAGNLAVLLGIEVSNLFECLSAPPPGVPPCDEARVVAELDRYEALGVSVIFPVHKYDNAFSAGDGDRAIIEIGNFVNSGHWSNFTDDCDLSIPTVFDGGAVQFGGLNMPRDEFIAPAPNDFSGFAEDPIGSLSPHLQLLLEPALEGEWCQNHGVTALGETLVLEMMRRGMILEIDHFSRRSYARVFEMLEEHDYPAAGTHGLDNNGRLYALGGVSKTGLGRCRDPERPGAMGDRLRSRVEVITANGGYPAIGFGFDLNGFAGAPGPRFGEDSVCSTPQEEPLTYPFTSYAGDVTFTEPRLGERTVDFNTEGMIHIGLMPELIEEARRDGVTDDELEPLFRSAEGYVRMWERARERAAAID